MPWPPSSRPASFAWQGWRWTVRRVIKARLTLLSSWQRLEHVESKKCVGPFRAQLQIRRVVAWWICPRNWCPWGFWGSRGPFKWNHLRCFGGGLCSTRRWLVSQFHHSEWSATRSAGQAQASRWWADPKTEDPFPRKRQTCECHKKAPFSMPQGREPIHPSELQSIICQIPSPKAKQIQQIQCEEAYQNLFLCFRAFFQELEDEGIDVQKMLLDCWKPLSLQLSLSWYVYFKKSEDLANQTSADQSTCREFEDSDWQSTYLALEMYHAWHRMKWLEKVRSNAAADLWACESQMPWFFDSFSSFKDQQNHFVEKTWQPADARVVQIATLPSPISELKPECSKTTKPNPCVPVWW